MPRGYIIAFSSKRDEGTGSSTIFRDYGGTTTISILSDDRGSWDMGGREGKIGHLQYQRVVGEI